ncbi:hypothetical protein HK098_005150 [Nowakowskiella sp. JEL0407]|nr:hypothetical protein HK098_005150 [Nowakowskiella sp. JEL0407]
MSGAVELDAVKEELKNLKKEIEDDSKEFIDDIERRERYAKEFKVMTQLVQMLAKTVFTEEMMNGTEQGKEE